MCGFKKGVGENLTDEPGEEASSVAGNAARVIGGLSHSSCTLMQAVSPANG